MTDDPTEYPTTVLDRGDLKPLHNLSLARKRPWLGLRAEEGSLFTDGAVIYHERLVEDTALAAALRDKGGGAPLATDEMKRMWHALTEDDRPKYPAKIRGYAARIPYFYRLCEYVVALSWKNYSRHWGADAKRLVQVRHIVGPCDMYVDERAAIVFVKGDAPAAVMKAYTRPVEVT